MRSNHIFALVLTLALGGFLLTSHVARSQDPANLTDKPAETESKPAETPAAPENLLRVTVETIKTAPYTRIVVVPARTAANRSVELKAEVDARLIEVPVAEGAAVKAGDTLIRLDPATRPARLAEAEALVAQRETEYEQAQSLTKSGVRASSSLTSALAALESARAMRAMARHEVESLEIKAPFDGILDRRPVEIGSYVRMGEVVATLLDLDPLIVTGEVAEREAARFKPGQPAGARLLDGRKLIGHIRYVGRQANAATRTFRLELELPNPDRRLADGLSAELLLPLDPVPAAAIAPSTISLGDDGTIGVKRLKSDDTVEFVPVMLIGGGGETLQVAGLADGDRIITTGGEYAAPGLKVEAVAPTVGAKPVTPAAVPATPAVEPGK